MLRCFLRGLAMYGIAHAGRGPVDGVDGFYKKPKTTAKTSSAVNPILAMSTADAEALPKSEEVKSK